MCDAMVLFGGSLLLGGVACAAPWESLVCAVAMWWLLGAGVVSMRARFPRRAVMAIVVASGFGIGWWRGAHAIETHESSRTAAAHDLGRPARCEARGRVVSSPIEVTAHATEGDTNKPEETSLRWDADLRDVVCDGAPSSWRGRATLYASRDVDVARGDDVEVVANLASPQRLWNEATGDPRPGEARRGVLRSGGALDVRLVARAWGPLAWIDRARSRVRGRIEATFPRDTAPMARAIVLGESDLATSDEGAFRASGLSHLLAVSGMHLVLVVLGAEALMRAVLVRVESLAGRFDIGRLAAAITIPLAWVYSELAGSSGSTLRAAWMLTATLLVRAIGRRSDGPRAFGASLVAMAAFDPLVAFDASFTLSAGATAGLLTLARPLAESLQKLAPSWASVPVRSLATTLAASIPCAPLLARFSPTLPAGGTIANLVAVPVGELVALPLCLAHAGLWFWPAAEQGCALLASGALYLVRAIARVFASAASMSVGVPVPTGFQLTAIGVAFIAVAFVRSEPLPSQSLADAPKRRWGVAAVAMAGFLLAEVAARRDGAPTGVLRATFLDVGQGDAAIVDLPSGEAMVIDGGGLVGSPLDTGVRVVAPALRARRRGGVAAVVLSHPHPDHYLGLATGLAGLRVGALWDTGEGERSGLPGAYAALLREVRARGAPILRPGALCGERGLGGARIEVLAPCPGPVVDRGANDNSFVLRISFGARAFLFVGDAEEEEEHELLALGPTRLRADVLKVGHHGSRSSSSPAFLAAVAPREAVISTGVRNRFGHPHPIALGALERSGTRIWRTDLDGAVTATTDGESLEVVSLARPHPPRPLPPVPPLTPK